ncbi:unnamed protein product [Enterobius vermicularis]|uniref:CX domain-containing protein n=1 Tax=Enterobius vermicularis TaxID=51028 RepID=A0A0N4UUH7_ENTVE|nr:unnamed protein product [Enterobius vermicularis]
MTRLSLFLAMFATVVIAGPYSNSQQEIVTKEDTKVKRLFCPRYANGEMCQENTMMTYYSCCGERNDRCCGYTRTWVWVVISLVSLLVLLVVVGFLLRKCYFKRRRDQHEHYVSGVRSNVEVKS